MATATNKSDADSTAPGNGAKHGKSSRENTDRVVKPVNEGDPPAHEEPELRLEESIPSDGKDEEGERMMEQLGRERRSREKP